MRRMRRSSKADFGSVRSPAVQNRPALRAHELCVVQTYDKKAGYVFSEKDWNTWSNCQNQDYYGLVKTAAEQVGLTA